MSNSSCSINHMTEPYHALTIKLTLERVASVKHNSMTHIAPFGHCVNLPTAMYMHKVPVEESIDVCMYEHDVALVT